MFKKAGVFCATILGAIAIASPAFAHVSVEPDSLPKGSENVELTFKVPNEEDTAKTTKVDVQFPTDVELVGVRVESIPGWTSEVKTRQLTTPISTEDGEVSEVTSEVIWTASAGGGIQPNTYQNFTVSVAQMPDDEDSLVFKTIQTYDNGEVVNWIQETPEGGEEPDHPAPTITLTAANSSTTSTTAVPLTNDDADDSEDEAARRLAMIGIGIALVALTFAIRRRR